MVFMQKMELKNKIEGYTMDRKKRLKSLLISAGGLIAIGLINVLIFSLTGYGIPCFIRSLTGLLCPGCGMSHAVIALFHGDIMGMYTSNALSVTLVPILLIYLIWKGVLYVRTGKTDFRPWEIIFLTLIFLWMLFFFLYRNHFLPI